MSISPKNLLSVVVAGLSDGSQLQYGTHLHDWPLLLLRICGVCVGAKFSGSGWTISPNPPRFPVFADPKTFWILSFRSWVFCCGFASMMQISKQRQKISRNVIIHSVVQRDSRKYCQRAPHTLTLDWKLIRKQQCEFASAQRKCPLSFLGNFLRLVRPWMVERRKQTILSWAEAKQVSWSRPAWNAIKIQSFRSLCDSNLTRDAFCLSGDHQTLGDSFEAVLEPRFREE